MTRLHLILLMALIASSIYLVHVAYDSRRLFAALDRAHAEERRLATDHERLKTELRSQATPMRVERVARERLAMRSATPAVTQYVVDPRAAATAASSAATRVRPPASGASR